MPCGMESLYLLNLDATELYDVEGDPIPPGEPGTVDPHDAGVTALVAAGQVRLLDDGERASAHAMIHARKAAR